ncbi:MAG: OmpA family protein [Elusimicrobiota bacterium]
MARAIPIALILAAMASPPLLAKPLSSAVEVEEESADARKELKKARRELLELQRKIKRKEIPSVEFEFNSAVLRDYSKTALDMVAELMLRHPDLKLMVFGYTCDIGSEEYNLWLSQKRTDAVKDYLVSIGVYGEFVKAKGYGEAHPLVPNDSEENRKQNRRVEFVLTTRWWHSVY